MTEKQLLARYVKEREELRLKTVALVQREAALDAVIASLRVVLGEAAPVPAPTRGAGDVQRFGKSRSTTYGIA